MVALIGVATAEPGDTLEALVVIGTAGASSAQKHSGDFSFRINPTGGNGLIGFRGLAATGAPANLAAATVYESFACYLATSISATAADLLLMRNAAGTGMALLELQTDDTLRLQYLNASNARTTIGSNSPALTKNVQHAVDVSVVASDVVGGATVEARLDGVIFASASGLTIRSVATTIADVLFGTSGGTRTWDYHVDDPMAASDGYPGQCWAQVLVPTSDATNTFTIGTWDDANEMKGSTNDGDTSFLGDATAGHVALFNFEDVSGKVGTIQAVVANLVVRDEGGASSCHGRLVSGATTDNWDAIDPGATYVLRQKIYNTDPNTGAAWTRAAVNALQFGIVNDNSVAIRLTAAALWVIYKQDSALVNGGLVNRGLVNGGLAA